MTAFGNTLSGLLVVAISVLALSCESGARRPEPPERPSIEAGLLGGVEQSFLVVGDSSSFAWPAILQGMLDDHSGGRRLYHVLNAALEDAPTEQWIADPQTPAYDRTVRALVRDYLGKRPALRGEAPVPETALCQTSLRSTVTDRGPVESADDTSGARAGSDALELLALRLRDLGLTRVVMTTQIYSRPFEPQGGHERRALEALLGLGHEFIDAGPDVWEAMRACHPACYEDDGLRPNQQGAKRLAESWYRLLAGEAVREDVVERMLEREFDTRSLRADHIARRSSG